MILHLMSDALEACSRGFGWCGLSWIHGPINFFTNIPSSLPARRPKSDQSYLLFFYHFNFQKSKGYNTNGRILFMKRL